MHQTPLWPHDFQPSRHYESGWVTSTSLLSQNPTKSRALSVSVSPTHEFWTVRRPWYDRHSVFLLTCFRFYGWGASERRVWLSHEAISRRIEYSPFIHTRATQIRSSSRCKNYQFSRGDFPSAGDTRANSILARIQSKTYDCFSFITRATVHIWVRLACQTEDLVLLLLKWS